MGVLATYHLLAHRRWVATVTPRLFGRTSGQARSFYLLDAGILLGFLAIGVSGLAISTWLELPLADYPSWRDTHVLASVGTLGLVVVKVGLHWRWVVTVAARRVFRARPAGTSRPSQPALPPATVGRREFVKLMGVVGAAAIWAGTSALSPNVRSQVEASTGDAEAPGALAWQSPARSGTPTTSATSSVQSSGAPTSAAPATVAQGEASSSCAVQCPKRCSYPGRCRRYGDANGNGRCDLGECT